MTRIRIEDLPNVEELTPEELEKLEGAGRPSFRPMLEQLEGREMYAANITASLAGGVLNVGGQHVQGAPNNDAVTFRRVGDLIQVTQGPNNDIVPIKVVSGAQQGTFNAVSRDQIKAIDMLMTGGNFNVDLTELGKMGGNARLDTMLGGGTADVRYINQAGNQVREWDAGRHNKETNLANGDRVLEQSNFGRNNAERFVTVTSGRTGGNLMTGEDKGDGDGFRVTTLDGRPVNIKFKTYGGMWDGRTWVPEQGQQLVERDGKSVIGEWKMIAGKLRWVETTGDIKTNGRVEIYQGFGEGLRGTKILSIEDYKGGQPAQRQTIDYDTDNYAFKLTVTRYGVEAGAKFVTQTAIYQAYGQEDNLGSPMVKLIINAGDMRSYVTFHLTQRDTVNTDGTVVNEVCAKGIYTKNVWKTAKQGAEGSEDHISKTVIENGIETVTFYHLKGIQVKWGATWDGSWDAKATWSYKLDAKGQRASLLSYEASDLGSTNVRWNAWWRGDRDSNLALKDVPPVPD
jgi:hypothetical protein